MAIQYGITPPALAAGAIRKQEAVFPEVLDRAERISKSKNGQVRDKADLAVIWKECAKQSENEENQTNVFGEQVNGVKDKGQRY